MTVQPGAETVGSVDLNGKATPAGPVETPHVPDRPKLAPGVHLVGPMTESAYLEPPWLIDRDGVGYLQVSPLLYRIAELCDGTRSSEQIAGSITESGEAVQPQTVERLVGGMLVPAGVAVGADGQVATPKARPRSPLSLAGRMKMLGPAAIEPLTGVLKLLFWPPLLILILVATIASRIWLYFVTGVAGPAHETLYHPVDMVPLFVLVVLSAGFHEFGHAAALRYGGGRVRGMGVGLYLIYPAVYTDVTENYRLSRWSRVRTDLGGFYFNFIFSLAVLAISVLAHQPFLLIFLLLTDIEILQQALPFARFDGYWALADITGIPDFFTHMGLFWRRLLKLPQAQAQQVPKLKPWGRLTLAIYSLVTVPVLLTFLLLTIAALPRVLATAWDSGKHQAAAAASASAGHDVIGVLAAAFQILILAFPAAAITYVLLRTFQQFETRLWQWARGSNQRRFVAALATLSIVFLCGFLWAPALPHGGRGPAAANLTPIGPAEHGTVFDLASSGGASLGAPLGIAPPAPASAAPGSTQTAPVASPAASSTSNVPTASPSASPSAAASASPKPSATPTASQSPTSSPTP